MHPRRIELGLRSTGTDSDSSKRCKCETRREVVCQLSGSSKSLIEKNVFNSCIWCTAYAPCSRKIWRRENRLVASDTSQESDVTDATTGAAFCSPHDSSSFDVSMCTAQPYTVTMQCMFWFSHGTFKAAPTHCTEQRQKRQTVNVSELKATART